MFTICAHSGISENLRETKLTKDLAEQFLETKKFLIGLMTLVLRALCSSKFNQKSKFKVCYCLFWLVYKEIILKNFKNYCTTHIQYYFDVLLL